MILTIWAELSHSADCSNIPYFTKRHSTCHVIRVRLKPVTEGEFGVWFLLMNFTSSGSEERPRSVYQKNDWSVISWVLRRKFIDVNPIVTPIYLIQNYF